MAIRNVYYEVAIRHSLGLPYALLSQHVPRFDLSHLQCHIYRDVEPQSEDDRAQLKHYLEARHKDVVSKGDVVNPISRFYGVPLAEVSPASGLSLGYYNNFIVQTMRDIRTRAKGIKVADQPVPEHDRKHIRLQIWIPDQLTAAQHQNIPYHLERNDIKLLSAVIDKEPRPFSTYALPTPKPITLIDVPTALSAIEVAISSRYSGMRLDRQSDEWKALEAQEIERFTDNLVRLHRNETDQELADKVSIHRWNTATGAVKLRKVPRVARVPIA